MATIVIQPPTLYDAYKKLIAPPYSMPEPGGKIIRIRIRPQVLLGIMTFLDGSRTMRIKMAHRPVKGEVYGIWLESSDPFGSERRDQLITIDVYDESYAFTAAGVAVPEQGGDVFEKTNCACFAEEVLIGNQ